ncbi:hypothetical protein [Microbacterium sp. LWH10-1.2]|uniref:hypothetical protein n=1 Tax=Microbacterium sp. LWH10-1.2 TaxID=3135255 RepID=UPI003138DBA7
MTAMFRRSIDQVNARPHSSADEVPGSEFSRRSMLKRAGVAAGLGVIAAFSSLPLGESVASANSKSPDHANPVDNGRPAEGGSGLTDLAGIHAEYLAAVATFPFALPKGVIFPAASSIASASPDARWERGTGRSEAYFFWHEATVSAAEEASARGDVAESHRLLDTLDAGYESNLRKAVWEDAVGLFASKKDLARKGDFKSLVQLTI